MNIALLILNMTQFLSEQALEQFRDIRSWHSAEVEQIESHAQVDNSLAYAKALAYFEDIKNWYEIALKEIAQPLIQFRATSSQPIVTCKDSVAYYDVYKNRRLIRL